MMAAAPSLYMSVLKITEDYLGPAAQRFLERQISFHLHKKPETLTKQDVKKLSEWVKVSLGMLTQDRGAVEDFSERINKL